ncbi:MAG: IclR family transcriptional regulator [Burkholderiales bacterium]|nr:IclR family transcriptional regulator [Burkholderiales bacterium]
MKRTPKAPSPETSDDADTLDRQFVTALARGLQVLACFTVETPELGVGEMARMLGLPKPTVWRLCHTLQALGYLVPASGTNLRPGVRILSLGYPALAGVPITELARSELSEIALKHMSAVSLSIVDGTEMVVLQRVQGSASSLGHVMGGRFPIASSASGWACLAGMERDQRSALIAKIERTDKRWSTLGAAFAEAFKRYKKDGYIINKGRFNDEINAVAMPLRSKSGSAVYSISSGGAKQIFTDEKMRQIAQDLQQARDRLQRALDLS